MKRLLSVIAAIALGASVQSASAAVTGSLGGGFLPFSSLSAGGLDGGATATLLGGTIYNSDQPFADIPKGGVYQGNFLAAGPSSGPVATLTFTTAINYLSFLWGSPDTYNDLKITSTTGTYAFTAPGLGFSVSNGDQTFSQYVQFTTGIGETILSAKFTNNPAINAFEVANFSVASAVPEPSTWAMMICGFLGVGFMASRRRNKLAFSAA